MNDQLKKLMVNIGCMLTAGILFRLGFLSQAFSSMFVVAISLLTVFNKLPILPGTNISKKEMIAYYVCWMLMALSYALTFSVGY